MIDFVETGKLYYSEDFNRCGYIDYILEITDEKIVYCTIDSHYTTEELKQLSEKDYKKLVNKVLMVGDVDYYYDTFQCQFEIKPKPFSITIDGEEYQ